MKSLTMDENMLDPTVKKMKPHMPPSISKNTQHNSGSSTQFQKAAQRE